MSLKNFPQYWKSFIAFVSPAAIAIGAAALRGSDGGSTITKAEWIAAGVAAIVTSAAVAAKSNAPKPPPPPDDEAA